MKTNRLARHLPEGMMRTGWVRKLHEIAPDVADRVVAMEQAAIEKYEAAEAALREAEKLFRDAVAEADRIGAKHWTSREVTEAKTRHVADGGSDKVCRWCGGDAMACYPRFLEQ